MAWTLMTIIDRIFNILLYPFKGMHPIAGLLAVSIVTGVVMLVIFGRTTNQAALKRVKNAIVASIIEIWLFKDRPGLMFGSLLRVLKHDLNYLRYSLVAVVFVIVPVVLIMVQLGVRYSHRPLHPSEETIVSATLDNKNSAAGSDVSLVVPDGLQIVTPALRLEDAGEVDWKIKAEKPGNYDIMVKDGDFEATKRVAVVNGSFMTLAPIRAKAMSWDFLLYPAEEPLPNDSPVKSIAITYPPSSLGGSWGFPLWLWIFFVVSVAAGFALKGVFHVEV
jgi:hypothetical protein